MDAGFEAFWQELSAESAAVLHTAKGLPFTYTVRGGELFVDRRQKSITKATVAVAYEKAAQLQGIVSGPKKLGVFGASYLYPIFIRFGVIKESL